MNRCVKGRTRVYSSNNQNKTQMKRTILSIALVLGLALVSTPHEAEAGTVREVTSHGNGCFTVNTYTTYLWGLIRVLENSEIECAVGDAPAGGGVSERL